MLELARRLVWNGEKAKIFAFVGLRWRNIGRPSVLQTLERKRMVSETREAWRW